LVIGKRDFGLNDFDLRELISQWFFMTALTGRYTNSPESRMEQDLTLLRGLSSPGEFINTLKQQMDAELTQDYWKVSLPNQLATASQRSPGQFAFYAALCLLDAPVLYSKLKVRELLNPSIRPPKGALDRHHLFPRGYLKKSGIEDRQINQVANYALVEWKDNVSISDRSPQEYVPDIEQRFSAAELEKMYKLHALPPKWYTFSYSEFLEQRRQLIAAIIHKGFLSLQKNASLA